MTSALKPENRELTVLRCWHCDFGTGQRGMDRCGRCDGSGSVFWVSGRPYPYTPEGEKRAHAAASSDDEGAK